MQRGLQIGVGLGLVGLVAFFALRPSPHLREIPWLPVWLGNWADANGVLRNVPAFALLQLVLVLCAGWQNRGRMLLGAAGLACALEFAQLAIPGRCFGWDDIAASWLGIAGVAVLLEGMGRLWRKRFVGKDPRSKLRGSF